MLALYRRHRRDCKGSHAEELRTSEYDERKKGWRRCECSIFLSGTLHGKFKRQTTGKWEWDDARLIAVQWEGLGRWNASLNETVTTSAATNDAFDSATIKDATEAFLARCRDRGMLRIRFLQAVEDPVQMDELRAIFERVAREPIGLNHSICGGDLGRLEFLCAAAHALGDEERQTHVATLAASLLVDIEACGPRSETPGGIEIPGLAYGLAGIGYGLLHLAFPNSLPSVLLLES